MSDNSDRTSNGAYLIWADSAEAGNKAVPSTEKLLSGFIQEIPTHQHFNWWMNRTDKRLSCLEKPFKRDRVISLPNTRGGVLEAGTHFTVPAYVVGSGTLRVELAGILCHEGADQQYVEVGTTDDMSTVIKFNDDIANQFSIVAEVINHVGVMTAATWMSEGGYYFVPLSIIEDVEVEPTPASGYMFSLESNQDLDGDGTVDTTASEWSFTTDEDQSGDSTSEESGGSSGDDDTDTSGYEFTTE